MNKKISHWGGDVLCYCTAIVYVNIILIVLVVRGNWPENVFHFPGVNMSRAGARGDSLHIQLFLIDLHLIPHSGFNSPTFYVEKIDKVVLDTPMLCVGEYVINM